MQTASAHACALTLLRILGSFSFLAFPFTAILSVACYCCPGPGMTGDDGIAAEGAGLPGPPAGAVLGDTLGDVPDGVTDGAADDVTAGDGVTDAGDGADGVADGDGDEDGDGDAGRGAGGTVYPPPKV
jgi:hypothetical protein